MPSLKVAYIITEVSGVTFYRCWQPANALREMGHKSVYLYYNHKQFKRPDWEWQIDDQKYASQIVRDLDMACEWADAVVWMALHTPSSFRFYQEMRLKHSGKPFILELDDIVFDVPLYNAGSTAYYPGSPLASILISQIQQSDGVVVSTPFLKERISKYHSNIKVVENTIDLSLWKQKEHKGQTVNIGWVGGATHDADLEILRGVVPRIIKKHSKARFSFYHGCPELFKHKEGCEWTNTNDPRYIKWGICSKCGGMDKVKWTHEFRPINKYPKWVSGFGIDIGIAPLVDNIFNRAKSNLRWLEYSAMGKPTIATPISHFEESIVEGRTGLFANTEDEWVERISRLIEDVAYRRQIGKNAYEKVKKNWSPRNQAEKYLRTIEELLNAKSDTKLVGHFSGKVGGRSEQHEVVCV